MDLKKDMCHLQKHTKRNRDADVQEKVKSLPGDLVYASRYWARHFAKSKRDNNSLLELSHEVCVRAPLTFGSKSYAFLVACLRELMPYRLRSKVSK